MRKIRTKTSVITGNVSGFRGPTSRYSTKTEKWSEILSIGNDHTKLKRAEEELRNPKKNWRVRVAERTSELKESEEKYRLLFDSAPIGIALVNLDGSILEVNRSVLEMLGSPGAGATKSINVITFPPLAETGISGLFKICMAEQAD